MAVGIDLRMYRMAGIGRYLQNLLPDLIPRLNASAITILGDSNELRDEAWCRDQRVRIEDFRPRIFSLSEQWAPIARRYRNIDLLWTPQYNFPLFYHGKLVVTIHDLCQLAHPETLGSELQRGYAKFLLSQAGKRAATLLAVSRFTASEIQKYLHVETGRIVVAYPPLGAEISLVKGGAAKAFGRSYFLVVGNVKKHKNLPRMIAAFNSIRDLIPHDLVIVGTREGFRNSEKELKLDSEAQGRIRFTGYIQDSELSYCYREAVALVFPSFYEGFGYPLVEAMAQGCPILCSNVASLPEVAGDAAIFFDPFSVEEIAKSMLLIASDEIVRNNLILRGKTRIHQFLGDSCAQITAQTINQLLECG